ncbi:MAG: hypothetical protein KKB65_07625 [Nanoarchaeota archaeon]|nr:hypothetical protein [Nanoarchaeota archaeon]MBU1031077.1 hypothetical protein [Nanoarchaeota archaeon]MBU1850500.1 hypothetical protein [Nanoarchaeota archaeon]
MSLQPYLRGLFVVVNFIVGAYIVSYAYVFLTRTKSYPDRKPWDFLFIAAIVFLISALFAILNLYKLEQFFGMDIITIRIIFETAYAALVLLAFITQSQMILHSDLIIISKKLKETKKLTHEQKMHPPVRIRKNKGIKTPDDEIKFEFGKEEIEKEMKENNFESEIAGEDEMEQREEEKK